MENKGSQGATLSPVKLNSGDIQNSINIPALANYKVAVMYANLYGGRSFTMINGTKTELGDDFGQNAGMVKADANWSGSSITIHHKNASYGRFTITQLWGIG